MQNDIANYAADTNRNNDIVKRKKLAFWLISGLKVKPDESKITEETIPKNLNQKLQGDMSWCYVFYWW